MRKILILALLVLLITPTLARAPFFTNEPQEGFTIAIKSVSRAPGSGEVIQNNHFTKGDIYSTRGIEVSSNAENGSVKFCTKETPDAYPCPVDFLFNSEYFEVTDETLEVKKTSMGNLRVYYDGTNYWLGYQKTSDSCDKPFDLYGFFGLVAFVSIFLLLGLIITDKHNLRRIIYVILLLIAIAIFILELSIL